MASLHHQEAMDVDESQCTPREVLRVLVTENNLSCNLRVFGSQLGLNRSDLDTILERSCPYEQRLTEILYKCHDKELLSWIKIASVLRKPALKQYRIAARICQMYNIMTGSSGSDSSFSVQSPGSENPSTFVSLVETGKLLYTHEL